MSIKWTFCIGLGVAACLARAALAQQDYRNNMQDPRRGSGRLYDANPRQGSTKFNRPMTSFRPGLRAGAIITGNVTGLAAFHGDSAIIQNNSFRVDLPSAGLADFRRQSAGVGSVRSTGRGRSGFYMDPAQSIADLGYIRRGLNLPGSSIPSSTSLAPFAGRPSRGSAAAPSTANPLDLRLGTAAGARPTLGVVHRPVDSNTGRTNALGIGLYDAASASSIFGPRRWVGRNRLPSSPWQPLSDGIGVQANQPSVASNTPPFGPATDSRIARPGLLETTSAFRENRFAASSGGQSVGMEAASGRASEPTGRPLSQGVGNDLFTDMRRAVAVLGLGNGVAGEGREGGVAADLPSQIAGDVDIAYSGSAGSDLQGAGGVISSQSVRRLATAADWAQSMIDDPVASFAGRHRSVLNEHMIAGEIDMREGKYHDAVRRFNTAHIIDPRNPLPLLARGHAHAAAGNYVSAARALIRGIEQFPDISAFRIDLPAMIGNGDVFDRHRAYLARRLEHHEDFELRFLLGYLEYYSGLKKEGLRDLTTAARAAKPSSVIAELPSRLPKPTERGR